MNVNNNVTLGTRTINPKFRNPQKIATKTPSFGATLNLTQNLADYIDKDYNIYINKSEKWKPLIDFMENFGKTYIGYKLLFDFDNYTCTFKIKVFDEKTGKLIWHNTHSHCMDFVEEIIKHANDMVKTTFFLGLNRISNCDTSKEMEKTFNNILNEAENMNIPENDMNSFKKRAEIIINNKKIREKESSAANETNKTIEKRKRALIVPN